MAIKLMSTSDISVNGIKLLVYGIAGAGKTSLIKTLPNPVVFSAEGGLLSIADEQIPYVNISNMAQLLDAYQWVTESEEAKQFDSIALDSISEIGEVVLNYEKKQTKDPRQAYGALSEQMGDLIRSFRDIKGKNVYFSAKLEKATDELGKSYYYPSLPGNKTSQALPYFFDEVLALRVEKGDDKQTHRMLMCDSDGLWCSKDRSGKLDAWEAPDLGAIIKKIGGGK